ncbi:MAG TPA: hypothetical protein VL728_01510 [Cyclobacteriaceae bacterium]|nr:hypothetical protein [Cyclobacteriaceae bacterium]
MNLRCWVLIVVSAVLALRGACATVGAHSITKVQARILLVDAAEGTSTGPSFCSRRLQNSLLRGLRL